MCKRPLIGITPNFLSDKNAISSNAGYVDGVVKAGGLPVLLPLTVDDLLIDDIIGRCDGFLLSGGNDMDAKHFNEPNYNYNGEINPSRDTFELATAGKAIASGKPVLGICRGCQVLNVAMGGSLYQDIHSQIKDRELLKHSQLAPEWYPVHEISVARESRIWHCYKQDIMRVNSFHHQAVKSPGKGLKAVAWSPDGIIEAIEYEGDEFAVGVQWHPERMWQEDVNVLKLFEAFVEASIT